MANPNGSKGTAFERQTADYWRDYWDDRIDRRVKTGAHDKGDLANVRVRQGKHRLVVECKNERKIDLAGWVTEAQDEAVNDEALIGIVVAKRKGRANPKDQYVIMTQGDLLKLLAVVSCP
jgi:hypothetical protein